MTIFYALRKVRKVCDPIRFLREREIVHYQRFGESLRIVQDDLDSKNFYAINPEFDMRGTVIVSRQSVQGKFNRKNKLFYEKMWV